MNNGFSVLFTVPKGITLILDNNITLDGNNRKYRVVRIEDGAFVMKNGATVRGSQDGGVIVVADSFTMNGGTISGNSDTYGGGVYVWNATFTMSGGIISGNSAYDGGGVYVSNRSTRSFPSASNPGENSAHWYL
ncbi:MAG: hypothetical protein LBL45_06490 [Treponema sp.]|nr:hypothetical protein [Treponema sp.]